MVMAWRSPHECAQSQDRYGRPVNCRNGQFNPDPAATCVSHPRRVRRSPPSFCGNRLQLLSDAVAGHLGRMAACAMRSPLVIRQWPRRIARDRKRSRKCDAEASAETPAILEGACEVITRPERACPIPHSDEEDSLRHLNPDEYWRSPRSWQPASLCSIRLV